MPRPFALPGAKARYAPDKVVHVEHYRLELVLQFEESRIAGTASITVSPILDDVKRLELDAVELEIQNVSVDGKNVAFKHDGKRLRIDFPKALAGQQTIRIDYAGKPRRGLYFIHPDEAYPNRPRQVWSQGQDEDSRYWFPCFDSPHEKSTSEVIATVPAGFFALSNGALVAREGNKFHWRFDVPHSCYLITLAAGEFAEIADRWEDIDVTYYVPKGREDDATRSLGKTPQMLKLFSEKFGVRYPYNKYAQVCVADFIFGGMENTTATTLTENCLFNEKAAADYDTEALVAHELAHQWFGDLLTCRDWGQGWLNEGFATYSEYIWREASAGRDEAWMELADWHDQYFGEDSRRYRRPIVTNVYEEPIDIFDHHLYEKGGSVLHMLRRHLGEGPFWKAIGHYVQKHRTKNVETRDLVRAIEEETGKNLDWFFDQWIQKAGHPELKVDYGWDGDVKLARFTVKQTQKVEGDTPLFRVPLEVRFRVRGKDVTLPVEVKDLTEAFFFPLDDEPEQAIFDAGGHILKRIDLDKPKPLWLAELAGATEAADRITAAHALGKQATEDVVKALEKAVNGDAFWGVRAAAAEALGSMRTKDARSALIRSLGQAKNPKARRAIVKALGELRHDEDAAAALEALVKNGDASYFVEAEACLALGKTRTARAKDALRDAVKRDSYLDIVRQLGYRGLAEARDEGAIPILVEGTRYGKMSQGRRAAAMALAILCQGRRDREEMEVRERIEELLADPDFRVQQAAIESLGVLGDNRAVPALRRSVDRDLDGRIRRRGREVIRDLEESRGRDEGLKTLRDEVDGLRRELSGLKEKLLKLETPGKDGGGKEKKDVKKAASGKSKKKKK
jgi:aminopeptidase N